MSVVHTGLCVCACVFCIYICHCEFVVDIKAKSIPVQKYKDLSRNKDGEAENSYS